MARAATSVCRRAAYSARATANPLKDLFVRWPWTWQGFPKGAATEHDVVVDGEPDGTYIVQRHRGRWIERFESCPHCAADLNQTGTPGQLGVLAADPDRVLRPLRCACEAVVQLELCGIRDEAGSWISGEAVPS